MNEAWASEWLRRFSAEEPSGLMEMYSANACFEDATLGHNVEGKSNLLTFFGTFMDPANRRNRFTLIRYAGDSSAGAVEWIWHAKHERDFLDHAARGRETSVRGVSVLRFHDGKVVEQHDYWDARTVLGQLAEAR